MENYKKFAGWLLSAACLLTLLLPAAACMDIFLADEGFSAESIALRFSAIGPWWCICLLAALAALPGAMKGRKAVVNRPAVRDLYRAAGDTGSFALIPVLLLIVAAVFILLGVINGGAWDVMVKAVNICTECIGLG